MQQLLQPAILGSNGLVMAAPRNLWCGDALGMQVHSQGLPGMQPTAGRGLIVRIGGYEAAQPADGIHTLSVGAAGSGGGGVTCVPIGD